MFVKAALVWEEVQIRPKLLRKMLNTTIVVLAVLCMTTIANSNKVIPENVMEEYRQHLEIYKENNSGSKPAGRVPPRAWRRKRETDSDSYSLDELIFDERTAKDFATRR